MGVCTLILEGGNVFAETGIVSCVGGKILIAGLIVGTSSNLGAVGMKLFGVGVCSNTGIGSDVLSTVDEG